ncbi:hypothetical protein B0H14DRAFT_2900897 [Mycena olivaceomarginata]|nr:hypothetical protein B0H14DRAFT_2900897 [Mycena olivaceomarginata]
MPDLCPVYALFFSAMGCTSAIVFTCECLSSGWGTGIRCPPAPFTRQKEDQD